MGNGKRPRSAFDRGDHKSPRSAFPDASDKTPRGAPPGVPRTHPLWSLRVIDLEGPFSWKVLGGEGLAEVLVRLKQLESMMWSEIEGREHHFVDVAGCCPEARERLQELRQDDTDVLFSIRVTGRRRVFGIRDGSILRLLWWDPEHAVYPSHKKHT